MPKTLSEIEVSQTGAYDSTGMGELDRVLGRRHCTGLPGFSRRRSRYRKVDACCLQVCRNLSAAGKKVLYISGEESLQQIRLRAERMGTFTDHASDPV